MNLNLIAKCLMLLTGCALASGAASLNIESAAARARTNNAEVIAARLVVAEARARLLLAGRLANPELEGELRPNVGGSEGSWQLGVSQKLPLTSRLRLERTVSRAELARAEAEVREIEAGVVLETRLAAVELAALDAHRELLQRQYSNSRELAGASRRAALQGEVSGLETAQLELEAAQLEARQAEVDEERSSVLAKLRLLVGLDSSAPLEFRDELRPPSVDVPTDSPVELNPAIQVASARVQSAQHGVALARAKRWDDATFGIFGEMERDRDVPVGRRTESYIGVRMALPLPFWNRNEGLRQEAEAAVRRAEADATARDRQLRATAAAARATLTSIYARSSNLTTNLLPRAASIEEQLRVQAAQGQAAFADVLRARERRLDLESSRLNMIRDFHQARMRYEAVTGRSSETR